MKKNTLDITALSLIDNKHTIEYLQPHQDRSGSKWPTVVVYILVKLNLTLLKSSGFSVSPAPYIKY